MPSEGRSVLRLGLTSEYRSALRVLNDWHCSPSGNIISVLLKTKRNHDALALELRNEDLGAFQGERNMRLGTIGEACACDCYDLVLLLHLCALPVFREQWQYSVKLPFLI